jgi:hypothetical protein
MQLILTFVYMKIILSCLLSLFAFVAIAQEKPKVTPAMKRFVYQAQSSIDKKIYDSIYIEVSYAKGNKWVFKFSFKGEDNEMMADDEFFESYEFEIAPPKGNSFVINEEDFLASKVIYNRSCFCADSGPRQLHTGRITGKKVSKNTWLVSFDGYINPRPGRNDNPYPKQWKGYFKPGKLVY